MSTTHRKTTARAEALLTLWVAAVAVTGIVLLLAGTECRAAATSQAVGSAVSLQASAFSASNVVTRIGAIRAPRANVRSDRDAILVRGLMASPLAMPPVHPRATRRYETTTIASLSDSRRPQVVVKVERPRVHVKRSDVAAAPTILDVLCDEPRSASLHDTFATVASLRGPPRFAGRRAA